MPENWPALTLALALALASAYVVADLVSRVAQSLLRAITADPDLEAFFVDRPRRVIRLVIFAGLLWGAGDLADLFVQSHHDLRCMRILLARLNHLAAQASGAEPRSDDGEAGRGRGDATH